MQVLKEAVFVIDIIYWHAIVKQLLTIRIRPNFWLRVDRENRYSGYSTQMRMHSWGVTCGLQSNKEPQRCIPCLCYVPDSLSHPANNILSHIVGSVTLQLALLQSLSSCKAFPSASDLVNLVATSTDVMPIARKLCWSALPGGPPKLSGSRMIKHYEWSNILKRMFISSTEWTK